MFHPNAYLKNVRNVRCGLVARTKILSFLDNQYCTTRELVNKSDLSYNVVIYHLRLLCHDDIVVHKGGRRYVWLSTGVGQTRLV
ncbi:MAG: hypothetical protein FWE56_03395 [Candidatus Bathyarchaeota archaeon]|nr:hypothetical protein [Candidatus Termiticorpusculum sp.]MCL2868573.1 hypothetical protein [Candidatus Termiticorpusculum sp.]